MESSRSRINPRPKDEPTRIILHFDYDCFYAQVRENQNPHLRSLPLGVKQKNILATCNYVARARGVTKLSIIADAKRICPDLVTVDGEDLTDFRDVSKRLYGLLRGYSWSGRVERLGLDEVWMDVSDMTEWNVGCLSGDLTKSWFCLVKENPEVGFEFDATEAAGCVVGDKVLEEDLGAEANLKMRLVVASHLARYLRLKIEEAGYTSACGISINKTLAKLAGNVNKPRNQTTLLCDSPTSSAVLAFMDSHGLRKVPGIGAKTTHALEDFVHSHDTKLVVTTTEETPSTEAPEPPPLKVRTIRTHPSASTILLERLLTGPGSEKGLGHKVWNLLHGIDPTPVKAATDIPTQISIEDTYGGLTTLDEITRELNKLTASLLRRMHIDLIDEPGPPPPSTAPKSENGTQDSTKKRWLAHPKTLRLTTRPKFALTASTPYNFQRATHSRPLPSFIFQLNATPEAIVARLATEYLLPMFRHLNPDPPPGGSYNIGLLNICVANMVPAAGDGPSGSGRDIAGMFARQGDIRKEFTVYDDESKDQEKGESEEDENGWIEDEYGEKDEDAMDYVPEGSATDAGAEPCKTCGRLIPNFAHDAHQRYHQLGD